MERKHYLDNMRWILVLLLFPFHAAQVWSGGSYGGFYIWSHTNVPLQLFSTAVYPWFMTGLFVIAGTSCRYALKKRTYRQFVQERVKKLLIPFVFGVLFLAPIMTYIAEVYFNGYTGSYLGQYLLFFSKPTDLTGYHGGFTPGHLWFLLYLFIISLVSLPLIMAQKKWLPDRHPDKLSYGVILLLSVPEILMTQVLDIGGKSLGQFLFLFLMGYYLLSDDDSMVKLKKYRWISLGLFLVSGLSFIYLIFVRHWENNSLTGIMNVIYGYTGILTGFGFGSTRLNFHGKISAYFTKASFPLYIIHMPVLVVIGFFVLAFPVGVSGQFFAIVLISFVLTLLLYEIIRRIPLLRMMFGIYPKRSIRKER